MSVLARYEAPRTEHFPTIEAANAFVEAEKASHRPDGGGSVRVRSSWLEDCHVPIPKRIVRLQFRASQISNPTITGATVNREAANEGGLQLRAWRDYE